MKKVILTVITFFICSMQANFVYAELQPLSQQLLLQPLLSTAKMHFPALTVQQIDQAAKNYKSAKGRGLSPQPLQISMTRLINKSIDTMGQWVTVNGQSVWRLHLSATNAVHLNLGFKNVYLPASATLFILNAVNGEVLKAYSAKDNKKHGELWTPLFPSTALLIELNINTSDKYKLRLELAQAGQGYQSVKTSDLNKLSGTCNIDVVCPEGEPWRNEIRSVARYTISDSIGTFLCTGTLINNTSGDLTPLFLTAAHCLVSETTAVSMVFYWNYLTSVCDGTPDGELMQTQTGARLISRWEGVEVEHSDFALVKLDTVPDASFNVYYSGWDNRDRATIGAVTIHHPEGDEKRISFDNDAQTITQFGDTPEDASARFLRVAAWDMGTTEAGSSGSGLWNLQQLLIGTLSGGFASCSAPTESDWYGRMAKHWLGNNFTSNHLATFLAPDVAPAVSAETTLEGTDNCSNPVVMVDVSTNTPAIGEQVSFTASVTGGTPAYNYQWDFNDDGIIDSTDANPVFTYGISSNNTVKLVVRDAQQCPGIGITMVLAAEPTEVFLGDGILPSEFAKTAQAVGSWIVDDGRASEGLFSLKSQIINGDQVSSIEINAQFDTGNLSFDRRVSSESNFDFFKFYIDDVEQFSISGEQDWSNVSFPVSAGEHTFRWSFEKDDSVSGGQDASWIDNLQLPVAVNRAPLLLSSIADQEFVNIDFVSLDISTNFTDPDNDPLFYTMTGAPLSLSITDGVISGNLTASDIDNSPYNVQIVAIDTELSVTDNFSITIISAGQPVIASAPPNQVNTEGDTINLNITTTFTDPDNDPLMYSMANAPISLSIDNNSGVISGTLTASDRANSPYTVTISASDGVYAISATFSWIVNALPAPPPPSSGGGGSTDYTVIGLLLLLHRLRRRYATIR